MIFEILKWQITIDYVGYPNWTEFRFIQARLDDSTFTISVRILDGSGNPVETPVSGPPLFSGSNGSANQLTSPPYYQYCDGTTLRKIATINTFPYVAFGDWPNDSQCQIAPVCDLEISSVYTTVKTTDPSSADGQIQVSATSSNGTIKYGLSADFDYSASTNTTGLFTGLLPGTYTVYAKDSIGCMDSIEITVEVTTVYGIRFRGEYDTVNGFPTKIEIVERGYDGEVQETCESGKPFSPDYDESNKFSPFVASHSVLELLEETEDQFLDLYLGDDRKFRVNYYKDFGAGWVLMWTGFIIPEFYQKPFVRPDKNYMTIKASDGLGDLKNLDFVDAGENIFKGSLSQLEIITQILKKGNLDLNLRIQDNIYEESMVVPADFVLSDGDNDGTLNTAWTIDADPEVNVTVGNSQRILFDFISTGRVGINYDFNVTLGTPGETVRVRIALTDATGTTDVDFEDLDYTTSGNKTGQVFLDGDSEFLSVRVLSISGSDDKTVELIEVHNIGKSPLEQAFVDVRIFYKEDGEPFKCDQVLDYVINCKTGLRLFQSYGVWWLVRSEYNTGTFDYLEYDKDGVLIGSGSYATVKDRVITNTGLKWANASQLEIFETNFGKFELTHILGFDDNLIDEGRFEEQDIVDLSNGNKTFKNWSATIVQTGISYGLEYVDNEESKGAFFMDFDQAGGNQADNMLYSIEIPLESNTYGSANLMKFKFQFKGIPYNKIPWILLRWEIRYISNNGSVGTLYLKETNLPDTFSPWLSDATKNDIYIEDYDSFDTKELTVPMPDIYGGTIRIAFYMHNHSGRDAQSFTDLKAIPTEDFDIGKRVIIFDGGPLLFDDINYFYELENSNDPDDVPNTVRPDDWVGSGSPSPNPKVWRKKGEFFSSAGTGLVNKFLLDNVQLTYIPFDPSSSVGGPRNFNPPETAEYDQLVNQFNKVKYEQEFLLGDMPTLENAKNLYRGYLRYEDGTPTSLWYRLGVSESKKLLDIALTDRINQLQDIQKKIQADILMVQSYYAFVDSLNYDSRKFLNAKYVLDDKRNIVSLYLVEMTTGEDGEPPVLTGAFSDAFSDAHDNG